MKTKIIYISGNEIFDMNDIRAAFEEVRAALNLDKTTVLFGVPVDEDDAGLMAEDKAPTITPEPVKEIVEETIQTKDDKEVIEEKNQEETTEEPVVVQEQPKKRGRPRKEPIKEEVVEPVAKEESAEEKVVPILSVLSTKDEENSEEPSSAEVEIIPEISDVQTEQESVVQEIIEEEPAEDVVEEPESDEADLEKLLSAMTPLQEDVLEDKHISETIEEPAEETEDLSVDATLEQLATEFAETQDKIATESKSSSRSKIGKLRNILPFKQSKHKDQGLGDLFGWAGMAANDEDFSVPGFFTNVASKK